MGIRWLRKPRDSMWFKHSSMTHERFHGYCKKDGMIFHGIFVGVMYFLFANGFKMILMYLIWLHHQQKEFKGSFYILGFRPVPPVSSWRVVCGFWGRLGMQWDAFCTDHINIIKKKHHLEAWPKLTWWDLCWKPHFAITSHHKELEDTSAMKMITELFWRDIMTRYPCEVPK